MVNISNWLLSLSKNASTNRHAYKKHAHQFIYDEKMKWILYKKVKGSDGIGEYLSHTFSEYLSMSMSIV